MDRLPSHPGYRLVVSFKHYSPFVYIPLFSLNTSSGNLNLDLHMAALPTAPIISLGSLRWDTYSAYLSANPG